jgi:hypothetical protein
MTIIPPKDEKPSINASGDMLRKRNIRRQTKFQDGRILPKNRPAHFHPEPTIENPANIGVCNDILRQRPETGQDAIK